MIHVVLWDVGNVLLRWDVRELYRKVFDDPEEMERFPRGGLDPCAQPPLRRR